tara:strand:+ start:9956 stop:10231 length:276 start_codon:yes stop_codon:yes gene_type:complete
MTITKKNISKKISDDIKISQLEGEAFLDKFLNLIKKNIHIKKVKISGFGTFVEKATPSRMGRNPKTRKEYEIKSFKKITFKSSSEVKNILN